jgi:3-hydroxyisobutyrate dehydrogenase
MKQELKVAFCGLGIMGSGMAGRLLGAGFPLTVYNRNPDRARGLAAAGARVAVSPREAVGGADLVISMVADDPASRAVWQGEKGVLAGVARGTLLLECSTVSPVRVRELAGLAAGAGCELLDAPVTGSKNQAAAGELNFLVGGSAAALEKARPALAAMARSITHVGPAGSGALLKLINNFLCGAQLASLAEALALIDRGGLDRVRALDVLTNGAPGSPLVKIIAARSEAGDVTANFPLRLLAKDLKYAGEEAGRQGLPLETAAAALKVLNRAVEAGRGDQDMWVIVDECRKR